MLSTKQIIRRPTMEDIEFLICNIRKEDDAEVRAMSDLSVRDVLEDTPELEKNSYVWEKEGKIIAMFGVNPIPDKEGVGVVWLLGTTFFDKFYVAFIQECKAVFRQIIQGYDYIFNYVHVKNTKSVRWLKWLGFSLSEEKIKINDEEFYRFDMVVKYV